MRKMISNVGDYCCRTINDENQFKILSTDKFVENRALCALISSINKRRKSSNMKKIAECEP
jgi:hypothetical protein